MTSFAIAISREMVIGSAASRNSAMDACSPWYFTARVVGVDLPDEEAARIVVGLGHVEGKAARLPERILRVPPQSILETPPRIRA